MNIFCVGGLFEQPAGSSAQLNQLTIKVVLKSKWLKKALRKPVTLIVQLTSYLVVPIDVPFSLIPCRIEQPGYVTYIGHTGG